MQWAQNKQAPLKGMEVPAQGAGAASGAASARSGRQPFCGFGTPSGPWLASPIVCGWFVPLGVGCTAWPALSPWLTPPLGLDLWDACKRQMIPLPGRATFCSCMSHSLMLLEAGPAVYLSNKEPPFYSPCSPFYTLASQWQQLQAPSTVICTPRTLRVTIARALQVDSPQQ